jgi:branched-chain amino acid transport system permease protein
VTTRRRERLDRPIEVLSRGVYALASARTVAYVALPTLGPIALLFLAVLLIPDPYAQRVLGIAAAYALLALSWDFLASTTGLVSLGQALFFGLGAYTTAVLSDVARLPAVASLIASALLGGAVATALLVPCLPLRGIYFSMTTLVYPLLLARIIEATGALGGTDGVIGIAPLPGVWFERLSVVVVLVGSTVALRRLLATDLGLVLRAVGDDDIAARAAGINVTRHRVGCVFVAAVLGSFAGAYFTHLYQATGMSAFALDLSVLPIACAVVGGMRTLAGPVLGAFLLVPASELARELGTLRIVGYSVLLAAMVLWKPEGLLSYLARKYRQFERWVEV